MGTNKAVTRAITILKRPLIRRIGRLVVRISGDGVAIRGKHKRAWREVTWQQILALSSADTPVLRTIEQAIGERKLLDMLKPIRPTNTKAHQMPTDTPSPAPIFDSPRHPLLEQLAEDHANFMARHSQQNHAGFDHRAQTIDNELHLHAVEICAESWDWQTDCTEAELWAEAIKCWRQSPGHWKVASVTHKAIGTAMAKSRRGLWYFVILAGD